MTPAAALGLLVETTLTGRARPFLTRLARPLLHALAPTGLDSTRGAGAPLGVEGLARRGPWERLLHSEWALLDVAPIEFLRRAADRELRFVELERERRAPPVTLEVRFDSGPACLGRVRAAQAAVLLACAARALAHDLELRWGNLSDDDLHEGLPDDWLPRFRALRRLGLPTGVQAEAPPGVHRWLVGRAGLKGRGHAVTIDLDDRVASVRLGGRSVRLGPIEPSDAAAFLRPNLHASTRAAVLEGPLESALMFSPSGSRLFCWTVARDKVWALPVPKKPGRKIHTVYFRGRLLAVGWIKQKLTLLTDEGGELVIWRRDMRKAYGAVPALRPGLPVRRLIRVKQYPAREGVQVAPAGPHRLEPNALEPVGACALDGLQLWRDGTRSQACSAARFELGHVDGLRPVATVRSAEGSVHLQVLDGPLRPLAGSMVVWLGTSVPTIFQRRADGRWRLPREVDPGRVPLKDLDLDGPPLGAVFDDQRRHCVVVAQPTLQLVPLSGSPLSMHRLAGKVRCASASPSWRVVAWLASDGELIIHQTFPNKRLGAWRPE